MQGESIEHFHAGSREAQHEADRLNGLKHLSLDLTLGHELAPGMARFLNEHGVTSNDLSFFRERRAVGQRWLGVDYYPTCEWPARSHRHRIASALGTAMIVYTAIVISARPWYMHWGTSRDERDIPLPGDSLVAVANYRSDHAITIRAPADSVWPWLAQLGQDHGGFYSYDRLERLFGDDVHNADRIHPEWQTVQPGDLVRAVQPDYLGGRLGSDVGWLVAEVVPGRALVLQGWGAFVVRPIDSATTRLHIRIRGDGEPRFLSAAVGPLGLLVFEPAHFIMERKMLLGIRARAEGSLRAS